MAHDDYESRSYPSSKKPSGRPISAANAGGTILGDWQTLPAQRRRGQAAASPGPIRLSTPRQSTHASPAPSSRHTCGGASVVAGAVAMHQAAIGVVPVTGVHRTGHLTQPRTGTPSPVVVPEVIFRGDGAKPQRVVPPRGIPAYVPVAPAAQHRARPPGVHAPAVPGGSMSLAVATAQAAATAAAALRGAPVVRPPNMPRRAATPAARGTVLLADETVSGTASNPFTVNVVATGSGEVRRIAALAAANGAAEATRVRAVNVKRPGPPATPRSHAAQFPVGANTPIVGETGSIPGSYWYATPPHPANVVQRISSPRQATPGTTPRASVERHVVNERTPSTAAGQIVAAIAQEDAPVVQHPRQRQTPATGCPTAGGVQPAAVGGHQEHSRGSHTSNVCTPPRSFRERRMSKDCSNDARPMPLMRRLNESASWISMSDESEDEPSVDRGHARDNRGNTGDASRQRPFVDARCVFLAEMLNESATWIDCDLSWSEIDEPPSPIPPHPGSPLPAISVPHGRPIKSFSY
eukprot:TRINITY_DN73750_c0_g1_i1.p1 TRINITY_DN73750_c0_g1~~TRINITY_DN73750_c0_g1_i1.p1  ORF type:complete len:523 (-),score=57.37 TRINITY_DN73750_c0_g1_i1:474-2042(-)